MRQQPLDPHWWRSRIRWILVRKRDIGLICNCNLSYHDSQSIVTRVFHNFVGLMQPCIVLCTYRFFPFESASSAMTETHKVYAHSHQD